MIEPGFCQCGCGEKTNIIKYPSRGVVGTYYRYKQNHKPRGSSHPGWQGGETQEGENGYRVKRDDSGDQVREHRLIAEKIYGGPLPKGFVVHHKDNNKKNNDPGNIIIFESQSDHAKHHQREIALAECGHADWRKCPFCKQYDDTANMRKNGKSYRHAKCAAEYMRNHKPKGYTK